MPLQVPASGWVTTTRSCNCDPDRGTTTCCSAPIGTTIAWPGDRHTHVPACTQTYQQQTPPCRSRLKWIKESLLFIYCCQPFSQLEQLERLRSEDTPGRPMITHTFDQFMLDPKPILLTSSSCSYWIPSQNKTKSKLQIYRICQTFNFSNFEKKLYTRHSFWSCLIRCANMKWTRRVL